MNEHIIYEQPVAENIRNFLKCEYLYEKYTHALDQGDIWSIRSSITTLIEISDFVHRINLKVELLKELEKSKLYIDVLKENNQIDILKYDAYHVKIVECLDKLNDIENNPSKTIVDNDFLMQIKNKLYIPGGDNFFDNPSYLNFLASNKSKIFDSINKWYYPFKYLFISSELILSIKRSNAKFEKHTSNVSFFEKRLDTRARIDFVRIRLQKNINVFPDISVNRQNINIIFKYSLGSKILSRAVEDNVNFEISLPGIK
ncbi:cell division protein ZapD [Gammaproteobacteria bacterium]|nr:cell division protein ZapD [Gammaproteobacteria bacterium]